MPKSERKWKGFTLSEPGNKPPEWAKSKVLYLGEIQTGVYDKGLQRSVSRTVEAYWWSEGCGGGTFYGYYGDGEYDYVCIQLAFGREHLGSWQKFFDALANGGTDESWRVKPR